MTWGTVTLNDGRKLPEIGWGSWKVGSGDTVVDQVEQAIEVGFNHIDTAQTYGNETEVGDGIRESGLDRKDIWLTTKWSGTDGKGIQQSIHESLEKLGVKSVDLYLIHSPRLTNGDPAASWREFESIQEDGFAKSIGVSNFNIPDLEVLRLAGLKTPAVNQILLHPYVWARQAPLVAYHKEHGIITEAYSSLTPVTSPGGPLDGVLLKISKAHIATPAAVLFAWARAKGAVIVTTSRSKERLEDYLHAGELELSEDDINAIDAAGAKFRLHQVVKIAARCVSVAAIVGAVGLRVASFLQQQ
ncbi:hypothetical protein RQP46_010204 [Phenoliferia psychrophenolica]